MYIVESLITSSKVLSLVVFAVEIRAILVKILHPLVLNTVTSLNVLRKIIVYCLETTVETIYNNMHEYVVENVNT